MTSNIYKLRNVPQSHRRFQAGILGPEEQIEAPLDFWLSVLFPQSLACSEGSGHWEGSKLQDWHYQRMETSFQHCQTPSPCLSSFNSKRLLTLKMFPSPLSLRNDSLMLLLDLRVSMSTITSILPPQPQTREQALLSTSCPLSQLKVIFHSFLHAH